MTIGDGLTAEGGEATLSASSKDTYTSGEESVPVYTYSITHQSSSTTTTQGTNNSINRFSLSGNTLKHTSMGEYVGSDHVTVKAVGSTGAEAAKSTYIQNSVTTAITSYGTPII